MVGLVLSLSTAASTHADSQPSSDTLRAQFLFVDGDQVYLRALDAIGPRDSLWAPGLGTVVESDPPILKLAVSTYFVHLQMGDTLRILRTVLRRRAAHVELSCDPAVWDPLTIQSGSAFASAGLFHRGLFRLTDDQGGVEGDVVRDWFWKGFDLFVVVDTSARFGDGTQVDANAVKASLERYFWYRRDVPEYAWQRCIAGLEAYWSGRTNQVLGLIPRSHDTLQFNMAKPLYDLPGYLATPALSIVRWQREREAAPVVATAGHYGTRVADTVLGRAPSYGRVVLKPADDSLSVVTVMPAATGPTVGDDMTNAARAVPIPALLVVRPRTEPGRQLLTFVRFAVDRQAVMAAAGEPGARSTNALFPEAQGDSSLITPSAYPDLEKAREARRLVRGSPRARIGYLGSLRSAAAYLVDALKAWDLKAILSDSSEACDVRLERWSFDGFLPCAGAEGALANLGRGPDDSLVMLLQRARQTADDGLRKKAYRSLLVRIADDSPYLALLQLGAQVQGLGSVVCRQDWLGRPIGPLFAPGEE